MSRFGRLAALVLALFSMGVAAQSVQVQGLFKDSAIMTIDGKSKLLKAGQTYNGVTLVEADSRQAVIEMNGERQTVGISEQVISGSYQAPERQQVQIQRNSDLQYLVGAQINGRTLPVLVDTGANIVAINDAHATSLGINYREGTPAQVRTASGISKAWLVKLDSVSVGGIKVRAVEASVLEGPEPSTILLGMSYLKHVKMHESGGILTLSRDFR